MWVYFYRGATGAAGVSDLLEENRVLTHSWIVGELALGNLGRRRGRILADLQLLPATLLVSDEDVLEFIESHRLYSHGIDGWTPSFWAPRSYPVRDSGPSPSRPPARPMDWELAGG